MKTKVIYLNEQDRPKEQKPYGFVDYLDIVLHLVWQKLTTTRLSSYSDSWLEYRNNFKSNNQPIEFTERWDHDRRAWFSKHLNYEPKSFALIVVSKNDYATFFDCYLKNDCHSLRFKGDLNSGTV